jgi:prevent-host-death family protein
VRITTYGSGGADASCGTLHKAKTQLSQLIEQVERGEEVVIARGKTPVARLVPYAAEQPKRGFGSMKGKAWLDESFWEPLPQEELKLWEGGYWLKLLLDTHALIWGLAGDSRLPGASDAIGDCPESVFVSAASAWEIATKVRIGKLSGAAAIATDISGVLLKEGFRPLAVTIEHGQRAGALPGPLRDPFDCMLIAQARLQNLHLVSIEHSFDAYGVLRLW